MSPIGSSLIGPSSPIGSGRLGQRRRQHDVEARSTGDELAREAPAAALGGEVASQRRSLLRELVRSPSSAAPCRPRLGSRPAEPRRTKRDRARSTGPNDAVNSRSTSGAATAASTSTTSWPSDASSSAASRAAAAQIGIDVGVEQRRRRDQAIRSAAGLARRDGARGSAAGGAHVASPSSGPARSRAAARCRRPCASARRPDEERSRRARARARRARAGLEPDQAAAGGRDPDRAAAVVAVGDGTMPAGRPRPPTPPRRAARRAVGVPRVARRRRSARLGRRQDPVLRQRRRADDDEARLAQAARRRCASWRRGESPEQPRPSVSGQPATARLFLIAIGTPANGRASPGPIRRPRRARPRRRRRRTR